MWISANNANRMLTKIRKKKWVGHKHSVQNWIHCMQSKDWFKFTHKSSIKEKSRCSDKKLWWKIKCYTRLYHPKSQFLICFSLAHLVNLANRISYASHLLNISSKSNRISSYSSSSSSNALLKSYLLFIIFIA